MQHNDFIAGTTVLLNEEYGVVLSLQEDNDLLGLIRWDTQKENDIEDWRGLFGSFIQIGGRLVEEDYHFKFINRDGSTK